MILLGRLRNPDITNSPPLNDSNININQENHDEDIERWENDGGMHSRTYKSRS